MRKVHRCDGCTRLFYTSDPNSLRCDAVIVGLSDEEMARAVAEGELRQSKSREQQMQESAGIELRFNAEQRLEIDRMAAAAEIAVARYLGMQWTGQGAAHTRPDVGGVYEVRHTPDKRSLLVRGKDSRKPNLPYILVTGIPPVVIIRGWAFLSEARRGRLLDNPPAYLTDMDDLHDFRRLRKR